MPATWRSDRTGYPLHSASATAAAANDPDHRAQNPSELLGKMLRIDVNVPDAHPIGLQRAHRTTRSSSHAGLVSRDLGVRPAESVPALRLRRSVARRHGRDRDRRRRTERAWRRSTTSRSGVGGRNYGWRNREGAHVERHDDAAGVHAADGDPIADDSHTTGNCITGGGRSTAARRSAWVSSGGNFFADYGARRIWSLRLVIDPTTHQATATQMVEHTNALGGSNTIGNVTGFGLGARLRGASS